MLLLHLKNLCEVLFIDPCKRKKKGIGKETEITDNEEKTLAEEHSFINTLS